MATPINLGPIHHLRLTVTDIQRSRDFYTRLLGFEVAAESPPEGDPSAEAAYPILWGGIVMIRGNVLMGLRPMAPAGDRFDADRVGLDHLSFSVANRAELEQASSWFDGGAVCGGIGAGISAPAARASPPTRIAAMTSHCAWDGKVRCIMNSVE